MAMSAAAKRKKRIIRQHERHQNKQPFYRWLAKRNAALPEISTQHGIYPKTLIPPPGKSDTHKAAYCLRLIRNIDAFDKCPWVWGVGDPPPNPPFLRLPAELRQEIFFKVLDDDFEITVDRPNSLHWAIPVVCKTFRDDIKQVSRQWALREVEVREASGMQRDAIEKLKRELGLPVETAHDISQKQKRAVANSKKGNKERRKGKKTYAMVDKNAKNPFQSFGVKGKAGKHISFDD